jgi:hypothetical protein
MIELFIKLLKYGYYYGLRTWRRRGTFNFYWTLKYSTRRKRGDKFSKSTGCEVFVARLGEDVSEMESTFEI